MWLKRVRSGEPFSTRLTACQQQQADGRTDARTHGQTNAGTLEHAPIARIRVLSERAESTQTRRLRKPPPPLSVGISGLECGKVCWRRLRRRV